MLFNYYSLEVGSVTQLCLTLYDPMNRSMPDLSVHPPLLEFPKLMSIESVMPSNHLILCCLLRLLPSIFPNIRVFSNESALHISGQSIGVSASALVLPLNIQDWFALGWTGWISLQSKGLLRVFSNTIVHQWNITQPLKVRHLSQWCHPTISSSVFSFSSCFQSFLVSGSFLMSQFFTSVAKVLEFQLQHQSFQWIFRIDFL